MADQYCTNKYDGGTFTKETRKVTNTAPTGIRGTGGRKDPAPPKTKFSRGQATGNPAGSPLYGA